MDSSTLTGISSSISSRKNPLISGRRTPSFSSSSSSLSSCSSYFPDDHNHSPISPATPLRFSGVPFSWEQLPGIPKKNVHQDSSMLLLNQQQHSLPLPPPPAKPPSSESFRRRDPFVAALVQCSKKDNDTIIDDDHDQESSISSSSSGTNNNFWSIRIGPKVSSRFGFVNLYTTAASCKRTCAVSESLVYIPNKSSASTRARRSSSSSYDLINRRRQQ